MLAMNLKSSPIVHVHSVHLDSPRWQVDACRRLLNSDELGRAARFHSAKLASRWIVSRARLREILANHLGVAPASLAFRDGRNGKPLLAGIGKTIHFNLSHSEGLALIAVCETAEVGVDVEYERAIPSWPSVAKRVFTSAELAAIEAADPARQQHCFYRAWTRKEALIKTTGEGFSADLSGITVSIDDDPSLLAWLDRNPLDWQLTHIVPAEDYVGAVSIHSSKAPTVIFHGDPAATNNNNNKEKAVA